MTSDNIPIAGARFQVDRLFLSAVESMLASIRKGYSLGQENSSMKSLALCIGSVAAVLMWVHPYLAHGQTNAREYYDREYGYTFKYPSHWKLQELPEGEANKDVRLMLQGPNGSSFMVVVEKTKESLKKSDVEDASERARRVNEMMQQTIAQIYQPISAGIKAVKMKVGERRDLSNDVGVKFYIATLHTMKEGKPIIVAGIHAFPFNTNYSINFTMTTFYDPATTQKNEMLTAVFNSFRLRGEPRVDSSDKPSEGGEK